MALSQFTVQPIYSSAKTFGELGDSVTKSYVAGKELAGHAFNASLKDSGQAVDFVKGIPVSNNMSIEHFFDSVANPLEKDGTNKVLSEITGINIWNTVESLDPRNIDKKVAIDRVKEYAKGLETQIVNQIKDCLDGYLQELLNKNPDLKYLLDIEKSIINEIGKLRNKVKFKVQDEIDKMLYDKIKLQQMALLRQKLTEAIRKICPSHNSPPKVTRISPSLTRQLNDDRSWTIVDGVNSLEYNLRSAEPELAHYAQQDDSTARKVEALSKEATENIRLLSIEQTIGNTDKTVFSYVTTDGDLV